MQKIAPIGSSQDYATDVKRALQFEPVIAAGHAESLPELAIRYVVSNAMLCTTEIGISSLEEFQFATDSVNKGPLPQEVLTMIKDIQAGFAA